MADGSYYQDYSRFSWQVAGQKFKSTNFLLTRIIYAAPFLIISYFVTKHLASIQRIVIAKQLHLLYFFLSLVILLIIIILDYIVSKSKNRKIHKYSISKKGLQINKNLIPISKVKNLKKKSSKQSTLVYKIPYKILSQKIRFNNQNEFKKFSQSLEKYQS